MRLLRAPLRTSHARKGALEISPDFEHDVLVWDEPLPAVDGAPPPVVGHLAVQQDRVTLPEVDLPRRAGLEVVQRVRLKNFGLCKLEAKLNEEYLR